MSTTSKIARNPVAQRHELRIPIPQPSSGSTILDLVFNVTRGRALRIEKLKDPGGEFFGAEASHSAQRDVQFDYLAPNVLRVPATALRSLGRSPRLTVTSGGELPELVKLVYRDAQGKALAVHTLPEDGCPDSVSLARQDSLEPTSALAAGFDATAYVDALEELLRSAPQVPITAHRRFFAHLDLQTNPALLPVCAERLLISRSEMGFRLSRINMLLELLGDRVTARARCTSLEATIAPSPERKEAIEYVSRLLLGLIDRSYGRPGGFALDEFEEAFELFANGDLRLQLPSLAWSTQPSSGFYFFFGEFALCALDHDIEAWRWGQLASVLVRSQRIFCRRYGRGDPGQATFASYRSCQYDQRSGYTPLERTALAREFAGARLQELRAAATHQARTLLGGLALPA